MSKLKSKYDTCYTTICSILPIPSRNQLQTFKTKLKDKDPLLGTDGVEVSRDFVEVDFFHADRLLWNGP